MSRLAAILAAAALAVVLAGTEPARAGARITPNQAIAPCGWLKLQRGGLLIFHGYYTTRCRAAAEVVRKYWRTHRHGRGAVGQWRCDRQGETVTCHGPKRQWAQGGWSKTDSCPHCGHIHLPPRLRVRVRQG